MPVTFGSFSDDNISATDGNDLIITFKGDDIVFAGDGNDLVIAGRGDDTVHAGAGNDTVFGGSGNDSLLGEEGDDRVFGGSGDDNLSGGTGKNLLVGGSGFDTAEFADSIFDYDINSGRRVTRIEQRDEAGDLISKDFLVGIEAMYFAADDYTLYLDGRNNAVLAKDDTASTTQGVTAVIAAAALLSNDTDFDGDTLTVASVDDTATVGTVTGNPDGTFSYDAGDAFDFLGEGETAFDTFTYVASDGNGGDATATVSVEVTGVNDAATFSGDTSAVADEEDGLVVMGGVSVEDVDQGEASIKASSSSGTYGDFEIDTDGDWTYTLTGDIAAGATETESFTIESLDGTEQVIDIDITGADDNVPLNVIRMPASGTYTGTDGVRDVFVADWVTQGDRTLENFDVGEDVFVLEMDSTPQLFFTFSDSGAGVFQYQEIFASFFSGTVAARTDEGTAVDLLSAYAPNSIVLGNPETRPIGEVEPDQPFVYYDDALIV